MEYSNSTHLVGTSSTELDHIGTEVQHPIAYRAVLFVIFTICCVAGIVGNCLVVYVVAKVKGMSTLTNMYLVSLACADTLVLLGGPLPGISEVFCLKEQWIYGHVLCPLCVYVQYLGVNSSALSITAFTIERYIGICHPFTAQVWSTTYRVKRVILSLWFFSVLYNSMWLYLAVSEPQELSNGVRINTCTFRLSREWYSAIYMADLLLFYLLPLLLIIVLYSLIGMALRQSTLAIQAPHRLERNRNLSTKSAVERLITDPCVKNDSNSLKLLEEKNGNAAIIKTMEKARLQVVKMLIVIASLFAILWLPYRAWVVYNSFAPTEKKFYNDWYYLAARSMVFINSAMNPILYSIISKKFRKAFVQHTWIGRLVSSDRLIAKGNVTTSTAVNGKSEYATVMDKETHLLSPPPAAV